MDPNKPMDIDDSERKLAVLKNGQTDIIQGRGLSVAGTEYEADVLHLSDAQFESLRLNVHNIETDRKGDKLTIRIKGHKPMTAQIKSPEPS